MEDTTKVNNRPKMPKKKSNEMLHSALSTILSFLLQKMIQPIVQVCHNPSRIFGVVHDKVISSLDTKNKMKQSKTFQFFLTCRFIST